MENTTTKLLSYKVTLLYLHQSHVVKLTVKQEFKKKLEFLVVL